MTRLLIILLTFNVFAGEYEDCLDQVNFDQPRDFLRHQCIEALKEKSDTVIFKSGDNSYFANTKLLYIENSKTNKALQLFGNNTQLSTPLMITSNESRGFVYILSKDRTDSETFVVIMENMKFGNLKSKKILLTNISEVESMSAENTILTLYFKNGQKKLIQVP